MQGDGELLPLPNVEGIVVLNIPSFAAGSAPWGSRSADSVCILYTAFAAAFSPYSFFCPIEI
jgi:hypothetical protein